MDDQNQSNFKEKFQGLINSFQGELKKTTEIGKKMIVASKANSNLNEYYEKLGKLVYADLRDGKIEWKNPELEQILSGIQQYEKDLEAIEKEVQDIKHGGNSDDSEPKNESVE